MAKSHHHKAHNRKTGKFQVKNDRFAGVDNTDDLDTFLSRNKLFSDMLGFTDDELLPLYENAIRMLYAQNTEDAIAAFSFLTKINPYLAPFWIGLGLSYMAEGNFTSAFTSFLMALTMDPLLIEAYEHAIDCCIENEDYNQAEAIVKQLTRSLKHCHSNRESKIIQHQIKKLEEKIALIKPQ